MELKDGEEPKSCASIDEHAAPAEENVGGVHILKTVQYYSRRGARLKYTFVTGIVTQIMPPSLYTATT